MFSWLDRHPEVRGQFYQHAGTCSSGPNHSSARINPRPCPAAVLRVGLESRDSTPTEEELALHVVSFGIPGSAGESERDHILGNIRRPVSDAGYSVASVLNLDSALLATGENGFRFLLCIW